MKRPVENPVILHAGRALERARAGLLALRDRLADAELQALEAALASLQADYDSLAAAPEGQLAARWSCFFKCYDHFLAALRGLEHVPSPESDAGHSR